MSLNNLNVEKLITATGKLENSVLSLVAKMDTLTAMMLGLPEVLRTQLTEGLTDALLDLRTRPLPNLAEAEPEPPSVAVAMKTPPPLEHWPRMVLPENCKQYLAKPVPVPKTWHADSSKLKGLSRNALHVVNCLRPEYRTIEFVSRVMNEVFMNGTERQIQYHQVRDAILYCLRYRWLKGSIDGPYEVTPSEDGGLDMVKRTWNTLYVRSNRVDTEFPHARKQGYMFEDQHLV